MRLLIASLVGLSVGMAFCALAHGHGAADWIRQNPDTQFCCGQQDCTPLPPGAVTRLSTGGYLLNGEWLPEIGGIRRGESYTRVFASADGGYWGCFYTHGHPGEVADKDWRRLQVKCLFVPAVGM